MKRHFTIALLLSCLAAALFAGTQSGSATPSLRAPKGFFGIDPQEGPTDEDARYMKAGGIETIRWPIPWNGIQPTVKGGYRWEVTDQIVATAARHGLRVLPFLYGTPSWISRKPTTLPVKNAKARKAWTAFLEAAVKRYGPGGEFWTQHAPGVVQYEPAISRPLPIRTWQIWNEANFFYFAFPVSPPAYAKLITISSKAIKRVSPGAKVILAGLFGEPTAKGARGMPATTFLERLYAVPGLKSRFDGVALHPYAVDAETLEELTEAFHEVSAANHDHPDLYVTEMGWGSQNNFNQVAFEQGVRGQVKQMRDSYGYLLENRNRLDLKQVYWFSWKDQVGSCNFCDSVGFFRRGPRFKAKPAWHTFVAITGGRATP